MAFGDSDSGGISIGAVAVVLIIAIVGVVWWMNQYGAGGAPQPAKIADASTQSSIKLQRLTDQQMQEKMKQDALNRRLQEGQPPRLTPEQERLYRGR